MDHFAGLDVSLKETSICIVDDAGKIVREVKVASEPEALLAVLKNPAYHFKRIGLEAGPLSQWLRSRPRSCVLIGRSWGQQHWRPERLPASDRLRECNEGACSFRWSGARP